MSLSEFRSQLLMGERPKLKFDEPRVSQGGQWLLSGRMIVEFSPHHFVPVEGETFLKIEAPFSDARDENDAVQQAARALQKIAEDIEKVAAGLVAELQRVRRGEP
jgi:hypothetical protein